jgi:hypothetical protein
MESKNSLVKDDTNQWLSIKKRGLEKEIEFSVVVEFFRFIFYCWFLAIVVVGMALTYGVTAKENKMFYEVIEGVFGSVNICAYFDFAPSTYVLPVMYAIEIMLIYKYSALSIFRAWIAKLENKISGLALCLYSCTFLYFCISACLFSLIFAVQPNPHDPKTILIHTIPFTNLILSLTLMQIAVTWFGRKVSWKGLTHKSKFTHNIVKRARWILLFALIITSTFKVLHHINALGEVWNYTEQLNSTDGLQKDNFAEPKLHYRGMWFNVHNYKILLQIVDKLWLISALIGPMIQSGYITFKSFGSHMIIFTVKDNRRANPQLVGNVVGQQGQDV